MFLTDNIQYEMSFDAVIPAPVLMNENLESSAKILYAFIRGLTRSEGYCFAKNDYLAEKCMKCDTRTIKRLLLSLKSEGFIKIVTEKNGVHWDRKIYVGLDFKKSSRRVKNAPHEKLKNSLRRDKNVPIEGTKMSPLYNKEYEDNIDKERKEIKERNEGASPLPPPLSFFSDRRVRIDQHKYENLIRDFGQSKIDEMVDRLDEYADLNPKRFKQYACHAAVIRKWIREDQNRNPSIKKTEINQAEKNKQLAQNIEKHFPEAIKKGFVEVGYNYVEFRTGPGYCSQVKFTDHGFVEQVLGFLRKMGASVDAFLSKTGLNAIGTA